MEMLMAAFLKCGGVFSSALASSDLEPIWQNGFFGSVSLNKKRSSEIEEHQWRSLKMARTEPHRSSSPHSLFSRGEQMLSFSSSKKDDAFLFDCEGNFLDYNSQSAEESVSSSSSESSDVGSGGMGSRGMNASINGNASGVRGPFTPSQLNELQEQIFIFRCIEAKVPIPSELLISFGKRHVPPIGPSAFSFGLPRPRKYAAEEGILQLGFIRYPDMEPGRCRRTDGKKWRCSRDAVENHKYCDRHINRGRHRSRKVVERQKSHSSTLAPSTALSPSASSAFGSETSTSRLPIAQMQTLNMPLNYIPNSSSAQLNRVLVNEENVNSRMMESQELSAQYSHPNPFDTLIPNLTEPNPFAGSSSLPPLLDSVLASDDSLFNLPTSSFLENTSFPSSNGIHSEEQNFLYEWSQTQSSSSSISNSYGGQMQLCIPQFSCSSSAFPENQTLSPLRLTDNFASFNAGLGAEQIPNVVSWDPVAWAASMGGPLGEVLANKSNIRTEDMNCSLSSTSRAEVWGTSPEVCSSATNTLQNASVVATSPSAASSSKPWEDVLGSGNVNSPTSPPL